MPTWTFAKTMLNQADKDRLACIYFHSDNGKIDWDAAAKDFGSASTNSFRTMVSGTMKKVKDAEGADGAGSGNNGNSLPATPNTGKKGGRKRKIDEDDQAPVTPMGKRQRASAKKMQGVKEDVGETEDGESFHVKKEYGEEEV